MSSVSGVVVEPESKTKSHEALSQSRSGRHKNYKGFVAGVFSGITKLSGRLNLSNHMKGMPLTLPTSGSPVCCTSLLMALHDHSKASIQLRSDFKQARSLDSKDRLIVSCKH